jgi:hypothetical protein
MPRRRRQGLEIRSGAVEVAGSVEELGEPLSVSAMPVGLRVEVLGAVEEVVSARSCGTRQLAMEGPVLAYNSHRTNGELFQIQDTLPQLEGTTTNRKWASALALARWWGPSYF